MLFTIFCLLVAGYGIYAFYRGWKQSKCDACSSKGYTAYSSGKSLVITPCRKCNGTGWKHDF
jgi:DnaJ-class molecular chaperone